MDTVPDETAFYILTAEDRCDSCGSQAYVLVSMASTGYSLTFCNHHWKKYESRLRPLIDDMVDETDRLLKRN